MLFQLIAGLLGVHDYTRVCSQLKQPNDGAGEADEGKEAGIEFVASCSDAAKLFEPVEEPLNQVAVFV